MTRGKSKLGEGKNVTDLVLLALRLLREDIREVIDSMEPVKP